MERRLSRRPHRPGYLSLNPDRCVRGRLAGEKAWHTIKGQPDGITRAEFEYPIPPQDARDLLEMCLPSVIGEFDLLTHSSSTVILKRHLTLHAARQTRLD